MKKLLTFLSLASLCFMPEWKAVLYPKFHGYHQEFPPYATNALAIGFDVLILTAALFSAFLVIRRIGSSKAHFAARCLFILIFLFATGNFLRTIAGPISMNNLATYAGRPSAVAITVLLIANFVLLVILRFRQTVRFLAAASLLLLPASIFVFGMTLYAVATGEMLPVTETASKPALSPKPGGGRIVWLIFDELDYRAAFEKRPSDIDMPSIDRLVSESFSATNAFPPAHETLRSIPALITGDLVEDARQRSPDELAVKIEGSSDYHDLKAMPNIFSQMSDAGESVAIVGWYHPYCRLFAGKVKACFGPNDPVENDADIFDPALLPSMKDGFLRVFRRLPFVPKLPGLSEPRHFIDFSRKVNETAADVAADPSFSFVYIHIPITHNPYFYDRRTHDFTNEIRTNYFDSLVMADDVFASIRQNMERSGLWNSSVVILTSDHWWRTIDWQTEGVWPPSEAAIAEGEKDWKVLFIVKPAGSEGRDERFVYDNAFNSVLSRDLLLALRGGEINSSRDIASWLDRRRGVGKTDY